jgi:eukaryotic-like serine/threonine-protein kinase
MPVSIPDFWKLLVASRLAASSSVPKLQEQFSQVKGADTQGNSTTLAQWLISQGALSKYQAKVLLAGHAGPFIYGEYTVYDRLSSGRLQGAFRAIHPPTRVRVTLSFHSGAAVQNSQWWSIVVDQIGKLAQAVHPNLARVYHLVDLGQFKFTSIEELQGESAGERLAKGPLPWGPACRMMRQVAAGLTKLLDTGQLHGAVRPSNVWINAEENAKLLLPPLARDPLAIPGPIDLSASHPSDELLRQADYMAPELAQIGQAPDARSEVYALGCTLFHLLARRPPFIGRDPLSKLASHAAEKIPTVDQPGVPPILNQVLAGMLAKDPARRYQHPRQVADVLGQVLSKFDPDQLRWRASPTPNKLQEFEAWIQPYTVAIDSQKHYAPEIEMPPILAASMKPPPAPSLTGPGIDAALDVLAPDPPPAASSHRTPPPIPVVAPSAPRPVAPAVARAPVAPPPANLSPPPAERLVSKSSPVGNPGTATIPSAFSASQMIFPPDQDVLVPAVRTRKPPRENKKSNLAVVISGVVVLIAASMLLWVVMNKRHHQEPTAAEKSGEPATQKADDEHAAAAKTNDENAPPGAVVKPATGSDTTPSKTRDRDGGDKSERNPASSPLTPTSIETSPSGEKNGKELWASPTNGAPISLAHLPPGVQALLVVRPAELLLQLEGEKLLAALGPEGDAARHELESIAGTSLANVEQLTVAWVDQNDPSGAAILAPTYVFQFLHPPEKERQFAAWGNPTPMRSGAETLFPTALGVTAFLPGKESGKVLVAGPAETVKEAAELPGQPPPLRREIEKLLRTTDDQRLATLLWLPDNSVVPNPAGTGTPWAKLLAAGRSFFGDGCRGAALSVQLTPANVFLELRVAGPLETPPAIEAGQIRQQITKLPGAIEDFLASIDLDSYGRRILLRFPQMLRVVDEFTRSGVDADQAVLRCYLPAEAAHNLLMGTELALAESATTAKPVTRGDSKSAGSIAADGGAQAETVSQKLKRITTLTFPNENLEKALNLLADDIHVKVQILGGDLQLEGITKNQPIRDLDEKNKPAEEILRTIMRKANSDGKLVYVIKPPPSGGEEELLITTRAAAAKRGDKLPPELAAAPKTGK